LQTSYAPHAAFIWTGGDGPRVTVANINEYLLWY
jgi:hypothetical protein